MAREVEIDLSGLLPHQRQLMKSSARKSALICGRGAGKSYVCAALCLLYLLKGRNVLVGGTTRDNVHETIYTELKNLAQAWGIYDMIKWRENPIMMELGSAKVRFHYYSAPEVARGLSSISLILLDEAFLAPVNILSIWGAVMRNTPEGRTRIVAATTPRGGSMWNILFSDAHCDWEIIHATSKDNPHIKKEEMDLILSEIKTDAMYRQEILGEIDTDLGASAIIRLGEFPGVSAPSKDTRVIAGLDCGEGVERDATGFFKRRGNELLELWKLNGIDHENTVRLIRESNRRLAIDELNMDSAFSDYEYNILKYEIRNCNQIHFAQAAPEEFRKDYANMRAYMYFGFVDAIRHGLCCDGFDLSPELKRQLCSTTWHRDNSGRLILVKKEELREALKMSPDIGDAGALTFVNRFKGDDPVMAKMTVENMRKKARFAHMMGQF